MLLPRHIWETVSHHVRRQSSETTVPPECYGDCNAAAEAAASEGKTSSLCDPNSSSFMTDIENCGDCLLAWTDHAASDAFNQIHLDLVSYAEYCDAPIMSRDPDLSGLLSRVSTMAGGAPIVEPTSAPSSGSPSSGSGTDHTRATATSTPISEGGGGSSGPPVAAIVPAVVIPVLWIGMAVTLFLCLVRRQRQRRRRNTAQDGAGWGGLDQEAGLAELHADERKVAELGAARRGELDAGEKAELPVPVVPKEVSVEADSRDMQPGLSATVTGPGYDRVEMGSEPMWAELDASQAAHYKVEVDSRDFAELPARERVHR